MNFLSGDVTLTWSTQSSSFTLPHQWRPKTAFFHVNTLLPRLRSGRDCVNMANDESDDEGTVANAGVQVGAVEGQTGNPQQLVAAMNAQTTAHAIPVQIRAFVGPIMANRAVTTLHRRRLDPSVLPSLHSYVDLIELKSSK